MFGRALVVMYRRAAVRAVAAVFRPCCWPAVQRWPAHWWPVVVRRWWPRPFRWPAGAAAGGRGGGGVVRAWPVALACRQVALPAAGWWPVYGRAIQQRAAVCRAATEAKCPELHCRIQQRGRGQFHPGPAPSLDFSQRHPAGLIFLRDAPPPLHPSMRCSRTCHALL